MIIENKQLLAGTGALPKVIAPQTPEKPGGVRFGNEEPDFYEQNHRDLILEVAVRENYADKFQEYLPLASKDGIDEALDTAATHGFNDYLEKLLPRASENGISKAFSSAVKFNQVGTVDKLLKNVKQWGIDGTFPFTLELPSRTLEDKLLPLTSQRGKDEALHHAAFFENKKLINKYLPMASQQGIDKAFSDCLVHEKKALLKWLLPSVSQQGKLDALESLVLVQQDPKDPILQKLVSHFTQDDKIKALESISEKQFPFVINIMIEVLGQDVVQDESGKKALEGLRVKLEKQKVELEASEYNHDYVEDCIKGLQMIDALFEAPEKSKTKKASLSEALTGLLSRLHMPRK